jgi:hypothetical protein
MNLFMPPLKGLDGFKGPMQQQFELFHELNPEVYDMIVGIALDLKEMGFKNAGIALIFERLRWLYAIQTTGDDYKLNNNYRAFYARLVMYREPELEDFFRLREQVLVYDPSTTEG